MRKGQTWADRQAKLDWMAALVVENGEGCREWPWGRSAKGYAQVCWEGRYRRAGHVILEMSGAARPSAEHHQLHSCDNPPCVAPWHLSWGTNLENRRESVARGRHFTKLTEDDVRTIYATTGVSQREIAATYGITQRAVWGIKNRKTWRRITADLGGAA